MNASITWKTNREKKNDTVTQDANLDMVGSLKEKKFVCLT